MFKRYSLTARAWRLFSPTRPTDGFAIEFPGRALANLTRPALARRDAPCQSHPPGPGAPGRALPWAKPEQENE